MKILKFSLCLLLFVAAISGATNITTTNDGYTYNNSIVSYAAARDATAGLSAQTDQWIVGQNYSAPDRTVYRSFASFAIPNMSAISAASLFLDGLTDNSTTDFEIYIVTSTYSNPLVKEDFDVFDGHQTGEADNGTVLNSAWNSSAYSADWNEITFDADGLAAILAKSNSTLSIALISKEDYDNSAATDGEYVSFESSGESGKEPYLLITYTAGAGTVTQVIRQNGQPRGVIPVE